MKKSHILFFKKVLVIFITIILLSVSYYPSLILANELNDETLTNEDETNSLSLEFIPDKTELSPGEEVTLTLSVKDGIPSGETGFIEFRAKLFYDTNIFEELSQDSFTYLNGWSCDTEFNSNTNEFIMISSQYVTDGDLVKIKFKVREDFNYNGTKDLFTIISLTEASVSNPDDYIPATLIEDVHIDIVDKTDTDKEYSVFMEGYKIWLNPGENVTIDIWVLDDNWDDILHGNGSVINSFTTTIKYDTNIFEELEIENFTTDEDMATIFYDNETGILTITDLNCSYFGIVGCINLKVKDDIVFNRESDEFLEETEILFENIKVNDYLIDTPQNVAFFLENLTSEGDYQIFEDEYIRKINIDDNVSDLKNNFESQNNLKVYNQRNEEVSDSTKLGTGMSLKLNNGLEYKLVVTYDLNGDGNRTLSDLSKMKSHIVKLQNLENEYELAADVNEDGQITLRDLSQFKMKLVGLE